MILAQIIMILLHGPNGHEIRLHPSQITSMHAAVPGKPNVMYDDDVKCVINTTDGKFISVVETCDTVLGMLKEK